jgi:hypothetical protein
VHRIHGLENQVRSCSITIICFVLGTDTMSRYCLYSIMDIIQQESQLVFVGNIFENTLFHPVVIFPEVHEKVWIAGKLFVPNAFNSYSCPKLWLHILMLSWLISRYLGELAREIGRIMSESCYQGLKAGRSMDFEQYYIIKFLWSKKLWVWYRMMIFDNHPETEWGFRSGRMQYSASHVLNSRTQT